MSPEATENAVTGEASQPGVDVERPSSGEAEESLATPAAGEAKASDDDEDETAKNAGWPITGVLLILNICAAYVDSECQKEEKALEKAEEKIAQAQEELNKERIKEDTAEAAELEKRADVLAQAEAEETEDEQISEEV